MTGRFENARTSADRNLAASVIVPTHARPERLVRLLESLAAQSLPGTCFEIVVVDDGSPEHARPVEPMPLANARLHRQPRRGPAAARNAGARLARGELLAFVDDDCVTEPGWLEALLAAHVARPDALLGGATRNGLPDDPFADVAESLLDFLEEDERRAGHPLSFVASNNIACGRTAFLELGGFDADYPLAAGEDRAFCRSWRAARGELVRVPEARVAHCHAHDLASFWRQQRNYGRGAARFHAGERTGGLPREPAFYARLLGHYARRGDRSLARRLAGSAIVGLSQLAVASGLLAERRSHRTRQSDGRAR